SGRRPSRPPRRAPRQSAHCPRSALPAGRTSYGRSGPARPGGSSPHGPWGIGCTIRALVTSLTALLCLTTFSNIFSGGAFPAVVPDMARGAALADWQLGVVAGAFGFARMVADIPLGLFLTHNMRRALWLGPLVLAIGVFVSSVAAALRCSSWDGS